jgi:hypothetical protein
MWFSANVRSSRPSSVAILAMAVFAACSEGAGGADDPALDPDSPSTQPAAGSPADALRLRLVPIRDPMVNDLEAFSILMPVDWQVQGGVVWQHGLANLATVAMRVSDATSPAMLEMFPHIPHIWSPSGIFGFPQGSVYLGQYVYPPFAQAGDYVEQVILPQHRSHVAGGRVVARESLPSVAAQVAQTVQEAGVSKRVLADRVRVEYEEGGRTIEEDFYCVLVLAETPMLPGTVMWTTDRMFSFRAEKGQLDRNASLLQAMSASLRINPAWFARYMQVVQLWQQSQMRAIQSAGELSRYIAQTNDEITAMHREAWEGQQASRDRVSRQFSEYVRGVEAYDDPVAGHAIELPGGYRDYWVSGSGEYILSDEASFNPNVGSTQSWQQMRKAGP